MSTFVVGIGQLVAIDAINSAGIDFRITPKRGEKLWLAWKGDADTGNLIVVRSASSAGHVVPNDVEELHRIFHAADPVDWNNVHWESPHRALKRIGRARAVTYRIPGKMPSNKEHSDWIHHFGDFGDGLDLQTQRQYWPALALGDDGSVYFLRTKGTRYALKEWLVG